MKSFIITLLLLALMLGGILVNHLYINNVANRLSALLDELPLAGDAESARMAREILSYWEANADWVDLSVSFPLVDRVGEQLNVLIACAECGDYYGYRSTLAILKDAVKDIKRLEKISMGSIF